MSVAGRFDLVDTSELLTLTTTVDPAGQVVVAAVGDIDLSGDAAFQACIDDALDDPACRVLTVDLRGVVFLGARGVCTLGRAHERARVRGVRLVVAADARSVLRALRAATASGIEIVATPAAVRPDGTGRW